LPHDSDVAADALRPRRHPHQHRPLPADCAPGRRFRGNVRAYGRL